MSIQFWQWEPLSQWVQDFQLSLTEHCFNHLASPFSSCDMDRFLHLCTNTEMECPSFKLLGDWSSVGVGSSKQPQGGACLGTPQGWGLARGRRDEVALSLTRSVGCHPPFLCCQLALRKHLLGVSSACPSFLGCFWFVFFFFFSSFVF